MPTLGPAILAGPIATSEIAIPFSSAAVAAALSVSVLGGFGLACVLSVSVGLQLSVGNWWLPVLQAHGHIQLVAWLGLFIIGVSLYFVPRLAGAPLRHPGLVPWVVGAVTLGVVMRGSAQVGLALWPASFASRTGLAMSGWLELVGIAGYLFLLISSVRAAEGRVALASVRVYFGTAFVGWAAYGLLNAS